MEILKTPAQYAAMIIGCYYNPIDNLTTIAVDLARLTPPLPVDYINAVLEEITEQCEGDGADQDDDGDELEPIYKAQDWAHEERYGPRD